MYSKDLKQYCEAVSKNPDELLELKVEGIRNWEHQKNPKQKNCLTAFFTTALK
jgi:hypothetical protein